MCIHIYVLYGTFFEGYKFHTFHGFGDFHKNLWIFYTDYRLKRHQCRIVKIVSLNFLFSPLAKLLALKKRCPTLRMYTCAYVPVYMCRYVYIRVYDGYQEFIPYIEREGKKVSNTVLPYCIKLLHYLWIF